MKTVNSLKEIFTTAEAKKKGINHYQLNILLKNEIIEKISHGYYRKIDGNDISEKESMLIDSKKLARKNSICLLSALIFYDLTDQISSKTWLLVSHDTICRHKKIKLFRKRKPKWNVEIIKNNGVLITTIERTIIDCLIHRKKIGSNTAIQAFRLSISEKKTSLSALIKTAKKMNVLHRVTNFFEAHV